MAIVQNPIGTTEHANLETEGRTWTAMGEKGWYRPVFYALVVLGVLLIVNGARQTGGGEEELAYGRSGTFNIEETHTNWSIIVFTDDVEANCENFGFSVDRHDGANNFVPVEKTSCDRWSLPDSYQFRLNNLTEHTYGFSASDEVTIVAVAGDLDVYMENYASGNAMADLGGSICCLSILLHVFVGRGIAKASNSNQQVVVNQGYPSVVDTTSQPIFVQTKQSVEPVLTESEAASLQVATLGKMQEAVADNAVDKTAGDEAPTGGAFWNNIVED